jgi:hypothetical protein
MASLAKRVYIKYYFLVIKMHAIATKSSIASKHLALLCDCDLPLGLHAIILPLMEILHTFVKFLKARMFSYKTL